MKTRIISVLVAVFVLSLTIAFAQSKYDCSSKASCDVKATASKSCCKEGAKAEQASTTTKDAKVIYASDKKSVTTTSSHCSANKSECSEAEKAACEAKMKASNGKMDCCKDKAKTVKAEKKTRSTEKSDAKGTN